MKKQTQQQSSQDSRLENKTSDGDKDNKHVALLDDLRLQSGVLAVNLEIVAKLQAQNPKSAT